MRVTAEQETNRNRDYQGPITKPKFYDNICRSGLFTFPIQVCPKQKLDLDSVVSHGVTHLFANWHACGVKTFTGAL